MEMGGNPINMWGIAPFGAWTANDPFLTANNLAGKYVYVSSGSGVGNRNAALVPGSANFDAVKFAQMVPLEVAASTSSQLYIARLAAVPGVKLKTHISPDGGHWWDYWQDRFKESWNTTFKPAFSEPSVDGNNTEPVTFGSPALWFLTGTPPPSTHSRLVAILAGCHPRMPRPAKWAAQRVEEG